MGERDDLILRGVREDRTRQSEAAARRVNLSGGNLSKRDVRRPERDGAGRVAGVSVTRTRGALLNKDRGAFAQSVRAVDDVGVGVTGAG